MVRRALGALLVILVSTPLGVVCTLCLTGSCSESAMGAEHADHGMPEAAPDCHAAQETPPCHPQPGPSADETLEAAGAGCCTMEAAPISGVPAVLAQAHETPSPVAATRAATFLLTPIAVDSGDRPEPLPPERGSPPLYTLLSSLLI